MHPPGVEFLMSDMPRIELRDTVHDCVMSVLRDEPEWRRAVDTADAMAIRALDNDMAPFWCRTCEDSYCRAHWSFNVIWDEAGPDYIMGTCPRHHEHMLVMDP